MSVPSNSANPPALAATRGEDASRARFKRLGLTLVGLGFAGLIPCLVVIAVSPALRRTAALCMIFSWIVLFSGKTILKVKVQ